MPDVRSIISFDPSLQKAYPNVRIDESGDHHAVSYLFKHDAS